MAQFLVAHVPSLQMDQAEVPFAGGQLKKLPFDEWIALESEFEYTERKYARADPVFWIRDLPMESGIDREDVSRAVYDAVWPAHTAFLLDKRVPLMPTPALSCCYVVTTLPPECAEMIGRAVTRLIGHMEREFIVWGSPLTYTYTAADLEPVDNLHRFLESSGIRDRDDEIRAAIDVLEETARPDSWYQTDMGFSRLHGFVRCMAAAENLLLSSGDGPDGEKTRTFGRHAAALFGLSPEEKNRAAKHFEDLYRFRSDLMHGRSIPDENDPAVTERLSEGRWLLRTVICAALALRPAIPAKSSIARLLKESWVDPERERMLAAVLHQGTHR